MSESDPKDPSRRGESRESAGGVKHDARGNAVWQWATDSGRHLLDSTSRLLKKLELPGLSIESEEKNDPAGKKAGKKQEQSFKIETQEGYNPYGTAPGAHQGHGRHRTDPPRNAAPGAKPAAPRSPVPRPAAPQRAPEKKPGLFGKLFGKR
ncbi:MAG: hypothetical protein QM718_11105 [Steroidobacteraceae bacterium]